MISSIIPTRPAIIIGICFFTFIINSFSQEPRGGENMPKGTQTPPNSSVLRDSLSMGTTPNDSLALHSDTTKVNAPGKSNDLGIEADVDYSAVDSINIIMEPTKKVFLYGNAEVRYEDITLTAACMELDMDSSICYAYGIKDSLGVETGLPVFTDKDGSYEMRTIRYNFKSEKAIIEHVVTEQGEGYVVSDFAKKSPDNVFSIRDGHYSTCDNHNHPHFYLHLTKAKVIPGKKTVTGPAYLVVEDVPFPIGIPFAIIPQTSTYSSGIIMPSYGEDSDLGLFLQDGGYYWAANDYFDMALTGEIYANGSWGISEATSYKLKYKYSGSISVDYLETIDGEKDLPDYSKTKDFSIVWSHRQDSKASAYSTFSASVNFSTSSYEENNVTSIADIESLATNTKRSTVSYSRSFPDSPFNFSANFIATQSSSDTTISLTAPNLTLTMSSIYPFKRKNKIGSKDAWYEKISLSYSGSLKNYVSVDEDEFAETKFPEEWENGMKHSIPVSMNLKLLDYFTLTPSISYTERWYSRYITQEYDYDEEEVVEKDTVSGFNRVYDYSFSTSMSTKLYTFYTPWKVFGDKIQAIRHVMTPSASLSYRPDFSDEKYGFYDWFEYYDADEDSVIKYTYSKYEGSIYGSPSSGESGSLGLSLSNTLEMKVKSDQDSSGYKKVSILESLSLSTSHNFLADSLKWSDISMSGRTKIMGTSINFSATFDPYAMDTTSSGSAKRINVSQFKKRGKLARLESASMSFGFSLGSDKIKKWLAERKGETYGESDESADQSGSQNQNMPDMSMGQGGQGGQSGNSQNASGGNQQESLLDEYGYNTLAIPWSLSLNYSFRLSQGDFDSDIMDYKKEISSDVNFSGNFSLAQKWKFSFSSGYSFDDNELSSTSISISRDLHCWSMSFSLVPFGSYQSYFFKIGVNSSMLQDLKQEKRNTSRD